MGLHGSCKILMFRGSHVGIWPRGAAASLFKHAFESAGIGKTFLVWSQDCGFCLMVPSR